MQVESNPDGHPWIYCADMWCHECGKAIKADIIASGKAPADPTDERSFDSDEFPKYCSESDESDCPNHCAAGDECLAHIELPDGTKIGALLTESLTTDGAEYVKEAVASCLEDDGVAVLVWKEYYDWIDFD